MRCNCNTKTSRPRFAPHNLFTIEREFNSFVFSFRMCTLNDRVRTPFSELSSADGSQRSNSFAQFWRVDKGVRIRLVLAFVCLKNTSENAQIWKVLPRPIECAKTQPSPPLVEKLPKFSTMLSYIKRMPPIWWALAAKLSCGARKTSGSSGEWPTLTSTRPTSSHTFSRSFVWRPKHSTFPLLNFSSSAVSKIKIVN